MITKEATSSMKLRHAKEHTPIPTTSANNSLILRGNETISPPYEASLRPRPQPRPCPCRIARVQMKPCPRPFPLTWLPMVEETITKFEGNAKGMWAQKGPS